MVLLLPGANGRMEMLTLIGIGNIGKRHAPCGALGRAVAALIHC